jgi:23S rRNA (adenine2030-N6)-methyltransferase
VLRLMNYRHHFHAGNFADVLKHAVLVRLILALQRKEKGFLYLDTHAGRGRYDLAEAATGDSLARQPEWPEGIGRLWQRQGLPVEIESYLSWVRRCDQGSGALPDGAAPRFYPGSPWLAHALARPQDRLVLIEKHPDELDRLDIEFGREARASVRAGDGYAALRAELPAKERRALVLIDPPFEAQDEFAQMAAALQEGLRRMPSTVFALWYPLTQRARVDGFFDSLAALRLPPTLAVELSVAGEFSALRMRGCGVVVVNPPWQIESELRRVVEVLAPILAQEPGAAGRVDWLVPES